MKVTVKRADRYARAAIDEARKFSLKSSESISIHDSLLHLDGEGMPRRELFDRVHTLAEENTEALRGAVGLIEAAYVIRQQIAEANMQHVISALLTREQESKTKETILNALLGALGEKGEKGEEAETAVAKAIHVRANPPARDLYGESRDKIAVQVPHASLRTDIETLLRKVKSERVAANERIQVLNVTAHIELAQKTVDTLRSAHIIDA